MAQPVILRKPSDVVIYATDRSDGRLVEIELTKNDDGTYSLPDFKSLNVKPELGSPRVLPGGAGREIKVLMDADDPYFLREEDDTAIIVYEGVSGPIHISIPFGLPPGFSATFIQHSDYSLLIGSDNEPVSPILVETKTPGTDCYYTNGRNSIANLYSDAQDHFVMTGDITD